MVISWSLPGPIVIPLGREKEKNSCPSPHLLGEFKPGSFGWNRRCPHLQPGTHRLQNLCANHSCCRPDPRKPPVASRRLGVKPKFLAFSAGAACVQQTCRPHQFPPKSSVWKLQLQTPPKQRSPALAHTLADTCCGWRDQPSRLGSWVSCR